ncbi:thioesterase family protein [Nocardiopsis potens]|uniref:thioesterase family protein n=1 Tax=Nocardiopsis potens TaxID=1246458 RepID=UPI0003451FA9|nr:thioesterase family protein [Nocardiopsis potens]
MNEFATATEIALRTEGGSGPAVFDADLDPRWAVGDKLHGGYLMAVLGRAAAAAGGDHRDPLSMSASFVRPPAPGPARVEVEVLRAGRGSTQSRARLLQDSGVCAEALTVTGLLGEDDPYWSRSEAARLPAEEECPPSPADAPGGFRVPLMDVVDQRLDPGTLGFLGGAPSMRGEIAGWQRLADGADWDPFSLLVALDMVPPVSYDLGLPGWAPTVQMSSYVRRRPAPGPVRVRMNATEVGGDRMDVAVSAWDSKDRLVAQAVQIAAVRTPH